jgi:outer membrane protein insertion porin family
MFLRSLAVAVVILAGSTARAENWDGRTIERIDVRGGRAADVRNAIESQAGARLDHETLEADVRALWKLGTFSDVQTEGDVTPSGSLVLTFVVTERAVIDKALVTGNHAFTDADLLDLVHLGDRLDLAAVQASRERVLELYRGEGFVSATVTYEVIRVGLGRVAVRFAIDEGHRALVHELRFIGNRAITSAELRGAVQTRANHNYQQEIFERDLLLVSAYYWDRGYANVKVGEPLRALSADLRTMDITIPIDEGPKFTISAIHVTGELLDSEDETLRMFKMRPGHLFARTVIANDREALSTRYQDEGYADAMILPLTKVDLAQRTIELTFEVKRGVVASFDRIDIFGSTPALELAIRKQLAFHVGELFNETELETSKKRIEALGMFDQVSISTKHPGGAAELVDVTIEVTEHVP